MATAHGVIGGGCCSSEVVVLLSNFTRAICSANLSKTMTARYLTRLPCAAFEMERQTFLLSCRKTKL